MRHPFRVGDTYRNRDGEYEVISIDEPKMVIRYSDGRVLEAKVGIQARIWQNIRAEEGTEVPVERSGPTPRSSHPPTPGQRGLRFQGLQEHDFQKGVTGTSWRRRTTLGGLLAQRMSDATGDFFQSYAIYRRAEVHIANPTHYGTETRLREPKFVFGLDAQRARYGFYIEKNNGPMDSTWRWLTFLAALDVGTALRRGVETAMRKLGLHWEVYVRDDGELIAQVRAAQEPLVLEWRSEDESENISWSEFLKRLGDIEDENWCDLFLCSHMDKAQAIDAGIHLAEPVVEVYRSLLPLYEASVRRTG